MRSESREGGRFPHLTPPPNVHNITVQTRYGVCFPGPLDMIPGWGVANPAARRERRRLTPESYMPVIREVTPADHDRVREFLLESSDLYPDIDRWCDEKVIPDLQSGARVAFVLDAHAALPGLAIAKRGRRAKLCSIRVREDAREQGWGTELLAHVARTLRDEGTEEIHVTVSEALNPRHRSFFERVGFLLCGCLGDKYVQGVDEFVYRWPNHRIHAFLAGVTWVAGTTSGTSSPALEAPLPSLLFSLRPKFAHLCLEGRKRVEFRRRFSRRHEGVWALFYVSSPEQTFQFTARIAQVHRHSPAVLWREFSADGGIDKETFDSYFSGTQSGYAVELSDVRPLRRGLPLAEAIEHCPQLRPPQSYKMLRRTPGLAKTLEGSL